MARPPKYDWPMLRERYRRGDWPSLAAFCRHMHLRPNNVRDAFRKLDESDPKEPTDNSYQQPITENELETGLTEKQILFVAEYLIDFNATRAALAAGYSKKTAYQIGWENLHKPLIQKEIQRQTNLVLNTLGITTQRVLLEYMKIAFADISAYLTFGQKDVQAMGAFGPIYEGKGKDKKPVIKRISYVDFKESEEIDTSLISEVKQGREGVSIKLLDKMKALEKLEKYLDLLPDNHKRMIENERLKLDREKLEIEKGSKSNTSEKTEQMEAAIEEAWRRRSEPKDAQS